MHPVTVEFHRAPDPVPVDEPLKDPFDHPHPHPPPVQLPDTDDDPVPDHKPQLQN